MKEDKKNQLIELIDRYIIHINNTVDFKTEAEYLNIVDAFLEEYAMLKLELVSAHSSSIRFLIRKALFVNFPVSNIDTDFAKTSTNTLQQFREFLDFNTIDQSYYLLAKR